MSSTEKEIQSDDVLIIPLIDVQIGIFFTKDKYIDWLIYRGHDDDYIGAIQSRNEYALASRDDGYDNTYFTIFIPIEAKSKTIIHESVHLAFMVLDYYDIKIDVDNHEMLAILTSHIVRELSDILKKEK